MKKFTGLWIVAIIIFCLGILLTVAGAASGATRIIKSSDGFWDKVGGFMESNILEYKQSPEIIDITESTGDITVLNVKLDGYAVSLKPTNKIDISVKHKYSTDNDNPDIKITTENGIMTIEGINTDRSLNNSAVEIFIPKNLSPEVSIETSDSAISLEELSLASLTCNTANAAISVEDVRCKGDISLSTVSALISVEEVYADNISIGSSAGVISFDSLHFNSLDINNTTGAINGELESRALYTVNITRNGNTETVGTGTKSVSITNDTGIINIKYDN